MNKPYKVVKGNHVPCLDGIEEGYSLSKTSEYSEILINVSAENIEKVFSTLCRKVKTPAFLVLEHGTNASIEETLRKCNTDPLHKDIYYLDGLKTESFFQLYEQYKELLINDGMINFGYASHDCMDEVFVGPYKIFTIYSNEIEKYVDALFELSILRVEKLKTVWDNFSSDMPGSINSVNYNGMDIYSMIGELTKIGLYLAERREDS